jgi:gliding motility-associated-like protein
LLFFLSVMRPSHGQQPIFQWAKQFGSSMPDDTNFDIGKTIAVDAQGNVYSAGIFFNTVDFDPGPGVYNLINGGIYISKLSPDGNFIWAKRLAVQLDGASKTKPMDIAVDKNGNVYLTAQFTGTTDFDPGPGVYNLTWRGSDKVFVLKLDTNGEFVWAKQLESLSRASAIEIDKDNNIVVCGISITVFTNFETSNVVLTKLTAGGNIVWVRPLGGLNIQDMKVGRSGDICVTGWFQGVANFDGGVTLESTSSANDGFILKLDGNGNFLWAKKLGDAAGREYVLQPRGIVIDSDNNIYAAGKFTGTQDFDPGDKVYTLTSKGGSDGFVVKLDPSGEFIWAKQFGGHLGTGGSALDISIDSDNNIYTVGGYSGTCDFDPGPGEFLFDLFDDAVLTKFDSDGNFRYACAFTSDADGLCNGRRLVLDHKQNIYITGEFGGTTDFDPGTGTFNLLEKQRFTDAFVVKLAKCVGATISNLVVNTCDSYTLNNHTYNASGIYLQFFNNSFGCDSIVSLDLTINRKTIKQSVAICEGGFFHAGGADQTKPGTYTDSFKTSLGCDSVVTTVLSVNEKPSPDLGPDKDLCGNTLIRATPGAFSRYRWQDGSTNNTLLIHTTGIFWVTVTNTANCVGTDSLKINAILQAPVNFLKPLDSVCSLDKLQIESLKDYTGYLWSTGGTEKSIRVDKPGNYWLTVTDANGCKARDTITVVAKECLTDVYFPTGFTPNGDGKNDYFRALVPLSIQSFRLEVYHRDGHLVFQTTDPDKKWDGTYKGVIYASQTFVWQCFYQLKDKPAAYKKGTVTLVR